MRGNVYWQLALVRVPDWIVYDIINEALLRYLFELFDENRFVKMNQGRTKGDSSAEHIRIQAYLKNREKELEKLKSDAVQWLNHLRSKISTTETKGLPSIDSSTVDVFLNCGFRSYWQFFLILVSGAGTRVVHYRHFFIAQQRCLQSVSGVAWQWREQEEFFNELLLTAIRSRSNVFHTKKNL